ncbi:MAG: N-acetylornithine carbamoyltransferase [Planctomycetota bacterium]|nr:N-acetylornithine carbamoyltransferase [Planctomycetota bacterium]
MEPAAKRDLLSTEDLDNDSVGNLLELAAHMQHRGPQDQLKGKTLGLLFQDPSLRTRVSFEVAMIQLGGSAIVLSSATDVYAFEAESQTVMDGVAEEHVKDAARTLSRYVDAIGLRAAIRTGNWEEDRTDALLRAYSQYASVPVVNLQSHMHHPCQALADIFTMRQECGDLAGKTLTLAWTQNPEPQSLGAPHSLALLAARMGMNVKVTHPQGFELDGEIMDSARAHADETGGSIQVMHDLEEGARGTDFVYARSWRSLGAYADPDRELLLKRSLDHWKITSDILALGNNAWFLHPLPVRRNLSVTDDVLDGERSLIYDQAENRLHTQKALLVSLM